jgi:hypothetical protein
MATDHFAPHGSTIGPAIQRAHSAPQPKPHADADDRLSYIASYRTPNDFAHDCPAYERSHHFPAHTAAGKRELCRANVIVVA